MPGIIETVPSLRELVLVFDRTKTTNPVSRRRWTG